MAIVIIIIESGVIILGLLHQWQAFKEKRKSKINTLFLSRVLYDYIRDLKRCTTSACLFELERKIRRLMFFIINKELQNQALLWFHENGIFEDSTYIETAINNRCIKENSQLKLAREVIEILRNR